MFVEYLAGAIGEQFSGFEERAQVALPEPAHVEAHRWRHATPEPALKERCLWDAALAVGAAGDWCGGPRIEGAWLSGQALAERVLEGFPGPGGD